MGIRDTQFEIRTDGKEGVTFVSSGNVVTNLHDLVAKGDITAGAELYASCTQNIGDEVMAELGGSASRMLCKQFCDMFEMARDYRRAAECAERAGDARRAARLHEADYNFARSGEHYLDAGMKLQAADAAARNRNFKQAAELYYDVGDFQTAAENFERAGGFISAGKLYLKVGCWDKAVDVLQRVRAPEDSWVAGLPETLRRSKAEDYYIACWLLGNVYEHHKQPDLATERYLAIVKAKEIDPDTVHAYYRLALLQDSAGSKGEAHDLFSQIHDFDGTFKDVAQRLKDARAPAPRHAGQEAPAPTGPSTRPVRVTAVNPNFGVLANLPIFKDLSLDELRLIHTFAESIVYQPGEHLIEQGNPGDALIMIISGQVKVTTQDARGQQVMLRELGPGSHVGEMSLVDESPTSANVTAIQTVTAYRLQRDRVRHLLATHDRIALRFYRRWVRELTRRLRDTTKRL